MQTLVYKNGIWRECTIIRPERQSGYNGYVVETRFHIKEFWTYRESVVENGAFTFEQAIGFMAEGGECIYAGITYDKYSCTTLGDLASMFTPQWYFVVE